MSPGVIGVLALAVTPMLVVQGTHTLQPLPNGFQRTVFATGFSTPTVMRFTPDGRLFVGQRDGTIRIVQAGSLLGTPLITIPVDSFSGERGLVGLCLDPAFGSNGYLYAYYTTQEPRNRVSRFTVIGNTASLATEFVVWENADVAAEFHHAGCIAFGPDGDLYIATGDQDTAGNSQLLTNQNGKLLRVTATGGIPASNPFAFGPTVEQPIWALGLRNPFRFSFDSLTGALWIGDVGGNNGDSYEELNRGAAGANYGWPNEEGPTCSVASCAAYTFPAWNYGHAQDGYVFGAIQGAIMAGPVYRGIAFPAEYQGNIFVGDYANRWIRRLIVDGSGHITSDLPFLDNPDAGTIVDLEVGLDGALYYLDIGIPTSGSSDEPAVYRIAYVANGNEPPIAVASASPLSGAVPLSVQFSSAGTNDPDNGPGPLSYAWDLGDGSNTSGGSPLHTYTTAGKYTVQLSVSDGQDVSQAPPLQISAGNAPVAKIKQPPPGLAYIAGQTINFSGSATDVEDGVLPPSAFTWSVVLVHGTHTHPFLGPVTGITSGSFDVPTSGHPPADTFLELSLTVVDSDGLTDTKFVDLAPSFSTLVIDTLPTGIPVFLDGVAVPTPHFEPTLQNFQHNLSAQATFPIDSQTWSWSGWSNGGAQTQTYTVPPGAGTVVAAYVPPTQVGTFVKVGAGLGGASGVPDFWGTGDLSAGSAQGFALSAWHIYPSAPDFCVIGFTAGAAPVKGGTLYVVPPVMVAALGPVGPAGSTALLAVMPAAAPSGLSVMVQQWFVDSTAPAGFTASNGLKLVVP